MSLDTLNSKIVDFIIDQVKCHENIYDITKDEFFNLDAQRESFKIITKATNISFNLKISVLDVEDLWCTLSTEFEKLQEDTLTGANYQSPIVNFYTKLTFLLQYVKYKNQILFTKQSENLQPTSLKTDITEYIINSVRLEPCIYDKRHDKYLDNQYKYYTFKKISSSILREYFRYISIEKLKDGWNDLVKSFKYIYSNQQNIRSGAGASSITWPYYIQLLFLSDHLEHRVMTSSFTEQQILQFSHPAPTARNNTPASNTTTSTSKTPPHFINQVKPNSSCPVTPTFEIHKKNEKLSPFKVLDEVKVVPESDNFAKEKKNKTDEMIMSILQSVKDTLTKTTSDKVENTQDDSSDSLSQFKHEHAVLYANLIEVEKCNLHKCYQALVAYAKECRMKASQASRLQE